LHRTTERYFVDNPRDLTDVYSLELATMVKRRGRGLLAPLVVASIAGFGRCGVALHIPSKNILTLNLGLYYDLGYKKLLLTGILTLFWSIWLTRNEVAFNHNQYHQLWKHINKLSIVASLASLFKHVMAANTNYCNFIGVSFLLNNILMRNDPMAADFLLASTNKAIYMRARDRRDKT
ncbi:hypothetical protein ACJX0J_039993, partial [Zea mays]